MIDQVVTIYCICDEAVSFLGIQDDVQCKMNTSEIMAFAITSALIYGCNYKKSRLVCTNFKFFKKILSHSQLVRRIHQIPKILWFIVFYSLQIYLRKKDNYSFIVDSFPVKAYENHKSYRARIFAEKEYHGYSASRKQYFFGIKVHMIVDSDGIPIEFMLTPGNCSDVIGFKNMDLELPRGSFIFGDKAYNNYDFEDALQKEKGITLVPKRKSNQKRSNKKELEQMLREKRNKIETVFSSITSRMPRYIKARTETGFCLKIIFLILAYMLNLYHPFV